MACSLGALCAHKSRFVWSHRESSMAGTESRHCWVNRREGLSTIQWTGEAPGYVVLHLAGISDPCWCPDTSHTGRASRSREWNEGGEARAGKVGEVWKCQCHKPSERCESDRVVTAGATFSFVIFVPIRHSQKWVPWRKEKKAMTSRDLNRWHLLKLSTCAPIFPKPRQPYQQVMCSNQRSIPRVTYSSHYSIVHWQTTFRPCRLGFSTVGFSLGDWRWIGAWISTWRHAFCILCSFCFAINGFACWWARSRHKTQDSTGVKGTWGHVWSDADLLGTLYKKIICCCRLLAPGVALALIGSVVVQRMRKTLYYHNWFAGRTLQSS